MQNVLVISYLFPPSGGVGVPRAVAYARYFPAEGCRASVLTVKHPSTAYRDPELAKLVPAETPVYRAYNPEPPYWLKDVLWRRLSGRKRQSSTGGGQRPPGVAGQVKRSLRSAVVRMVFPDIQASWFPFAVRKAARIVREREIDTVVVIAPPYSLLKIGVALKRKFPHLNLITDLRDDWLGYYVAGADGPSDYALGWGQREWERARALEREAFRVSSVVSIATPKWAEDLRRRYPDLPPQKFICTTNGYEPELFRNEFRKLRQPGGPIVITYLGTLNTSPVYSPATFLRALDLLPQAVRSRFEVRVIGRVTPECRAMLERPELSLYGFVPKQQGIDLLREADMLLLIATNPSSHAGKLFDYLATGKPILALSPPEGEIGKVLRETGSGWCASPFDAEALARSLQQCAERLDSGGALTEPHWDAVERYSWPAIVGRLSGEIRAAEAAAHSQPRPGRALQSEMQGCR